MFIWEESPLSSYKKGEENIDKEKERDVEALPGWEVRVMNQEGV